MNAFDEREITWILPGGLIAGDSLDWTKTMKREKDRVIGDQIYTQQREMDLGPLDLTPRTSNLFSPDVIALQLEEAAAEFIRTCKHPMDMLRFSPSNSNYTVRTVSSLESLVSYRLERRLEIHT